MMDPTVDENAEDTFAFSSSIADDVWHAGKPHLAHEAWYFDALSDDGNEAVTVTFLDNSIYSPLNRRMGERQSSRERSITPAIAFTYFRGGKVRYRTMLEFAAETFQASETEPFVKIGASTISCRSASYGSGYHIQIDTALNSGRRMRANFEWLVIESDLHPTKRGAAMSTHSWNMVAPRCDVTGKVAITDRKGRGADTFQFRGTGYHDHTRRPAAATGEWHWGRAHFADTTAVFYGRPNALGSGAATKLMLVRDSDLTQRDVHFEGQNAVRNGFGSKYLSRIRLMSDDHVRLRVKPMRMIEGGFYSTRFLSEMTLTLRDGVPRRTTGISGFAVTRASTHRWLNWLAELRTRKNERASRT